MKVTLKEQSSVVYQRTTHQITVEIDGVDYLIRQSEDDNGCDYFVFSESLGGDWMNPYDIEDGDLQEAIEKLASACHDDYTFGSEIKEGDEIDIENFEY